MKKPVFPQLVVLILGVMLIGCASIAPTTLPPAIKSETLALAKPEWEQKWDQLVAAAKKEQKIVVASSIGPEIRNAIGDAFKQRYGVEVEFLIGRPAELVPKVLAERRAGLYLVDAFIAGVPLMMAELKPIGAIEPLDHLLIVPEVLDREKWWGGDLLWVDREHYQIGLLAYPKAPLVINTDLVKFGDVKSYRDLLRPEWKGKMLLYDPTISGAGNTWFQALVKGGIMDLDYMKSLARQEPIITRDTRLHIEWVARGKYPIAVAPRTETAIEFEQLGAPVKLITPSEGTYLIFGVAGLSVMNNAPHPNAAKLLVNWLLSREGGTIFSKAHGGQSARLDVLTEGLHPESVRKAGVDYIFTDTEEFFREFDKITRLIKDVFGHFMK